ncbi:MAG: hypothetical protein HYT11_02750 [Candidatus Levybacteria bacterium]|nr:hypothetical protein [Candidatus Levybacteria bacterium]
MNDLIKTIQHIVSRSTELKNKYTDVSKAPVEFACIFCQSEEEYELFTNAIKPLGKIAEDTKNGFTYFLDNPITTASGPLRFVKIRKPDFRKERGDADFNTDYRKFKEKYLNDPKFELVTYENFEMLRLSDYSFDVMACFSNISKSKVLGITL